MFQMMNEARIEVGVQGLSLASAAYLSARDYALERVQGTVTTADGPRPAKIIEHPDVKRMMLRMRAIVEGGRSLIYHLMLYQDLAHYTDEGERYQALVELLTPICKSYCSDQGFRVTELAVQTYGGYGYTQEYPAELYLRDAKISSIYEGTNGIQALDLLFRKILMNKGAYLRTWLADVAAVCQSTQGTPLSQAAQRLQESTEQLVKTVEVFGKWAANGKVDAVRFRATEFQEQMGHIMIAYFLLKQAITAHQALQGDVSDLDRTFYEQKGVTCRYFAREVVPNAGAALANMVHEEVPGLESVF
jgi:hypothetical protein